MNIKLPDLTNSTLFFALVFFISMGELQAQTHTRYASACFDSVRIIETTYNAEFNLKADVYAPVVDTLAKRPFIVLAHGGSFMGGTKNNPTIVNLATQWAKRGFVVAAINYRLAQSMGDFFDTSKAALLVVNAIADGKSSVAFFKENASKFKLDTARFAFAGNSAGGIIAMHVGFLDSTDRQSSSLSGAIRKSNLQLQNPQFSAASRVSAVINMAGAIKERSYINNPNVAVLCFHGEADDVVPINCGSVYQRMCGFAKMITVCGSEPICEEAQKIGAPYKLITYPGKHLPWKTTVASQSNALLDDVAQQSANFLRALWQL